MEKTLGDVFANLSYGLLSNLSEGGNGSGTIPDAQQKRMIYLLNQGLIALYSRFVLLEREFLLRAINFKSEYLLHSDHAVSKVGIEDGWVFDTASDPFTDDIVKILWVADEDGIAIPLNDSQTEEDQSFFTPSSNLLQIPYPVSGDFYYIGYQAYHRTLVSSEDLDLNQIISLPGVLFTALEYHVAAHVMSAKNGQEHALKGVEHLANYERICIEVETNNTLNLSIVETNAKLEERGFK